MPGKTPSIHHSSLIIHLNRRTFGMEINKVGVLGCGLMGSGIAQAAAAAGCDVIVREVTDELCERGFAGIEKSLAKFARSEEHTSELQSRQYLVCRLLLEKK